MNQNTACPIWETPATVHLDRHRDGRKVDSPRAGGCYFISETAVKEISNLDAPAKARLTTWLIDQRRLGVDCPEVDSSKIKDVERFPPFADP